MTHRQNISTFISRLTVSLLLIVALPQVRAQKMFRMEKDSIPFFRGVSVSFNLVGAAKLMFGDYGEYEGALRVNLHDQWFPTVEGGVGKANHEQDEVTGLTYKTSAPYFKVGMDWNILTNKHQPNRLYVGFRYAFTSFKCDIIRENLPDPVWHTQTGFGTRDLAYSQQWLEAVLGIDAQVFGPFHLGWSVRYKRRTVNKEADIGKAWYVPGYGLSDKDGFDVNFSAILQI